MLKDAHEGIYPPTHMGRLFHPPWRFPANVKSPKDELPDLRFILPECFDIAIRWTLKTFESLSRPQEGILLSQRREQQPTIEDAELNVVTDGVGDLT
jgi:hypothetical protein